MSSNPRVLILKRENRDIRFVVSFLAEAYLTVNQGIKSVVLAHAYVKAWVVDGTPLTNEDISRLNSLIAEFLDTESLAVRLTTVLGTTDAFLCAIIYSSR